MKKLVYYSLRHFSKGPSKKNYPNFMRNEKNIKESLKQSTLSPMFVGTQDEGPILGDFRYRYDFEQSDIKGIRHDSETKGGLKMMMYRCGVCNTK